jgi:uncharacterized hydrophobic protein (TIGR00271 family)
MAALSLISRWRRSIVGRIDHERIVAHILEESGWSARYAFMTMMSAGIAVLGLLLASPAVVIGAMLISPLMNPILGFGFSLALFDFKEMRRSITALILGAVTAVLFTALIVLASPLKTATAEILARTRPNLFDLLVALFAALAGSFAIIRGRGETIVGVAIATALMPPLAVVGYGLATWNVPVFSGAAVLFITNFMTIALAATVMARLYGFGHRLSSQQSWTQTIILIVVFVAMSIPLAISLGRIAREALTVNAVRAYLVDRFGPQARVTQLDVEFERQPIAVRAVVIAPRSRAVGSPQLAAGLEKTLGRPLTLQVDQVLLNPGSRPLDAQRAELEQANDAARVTETRDAVAHLVALAAGIKPEAVTVDSEGQRASATAAPLPGATLETYHALEARVSAAEEGWQIVVTPPLGPLPVIHFADGIDSPDDSARQAIMLSCWAARRWNIARLGIPGLPAGAVAPPHPLLAQRRALHIAEILRSQGLAAAPLPDAGQDIQLTPLPPASQP